MVMSFQDDAAGRPIPDYSFQKSAAPVANPVAPTGPTQPPTVTVSGQNPNADPAMLAFLRQAGASESLARMAVANQKSKINRQIAMSAPAYQDSLRQGLQGIANSAEANGMYESGKRLQDQNDFQVSAARQQNAYLQGLRDQMNEADLQLAQQIAQINQQKAEQQLNSQINVAQWKAQNS